MVFLINVFFISSQERILEILLKVKVLLVSTYFFMKKNTNNFWLKKKELYLELELQGIPLDDEM